MATRNRTSKAAARPARAPAPRPSGLTLGVDGGGTKTRAVLLGAGGEFVGEGAAGPSNPLRVGVGAAASAVREAVDRACAAGRVSRAEIEAAEVGLAGVKRADLRERMRQVLAGRLGVGPFEVVPDADIALYGATGGEPGLVLIAGTGSVCCGVNARGARAYAGGWGPVAGDEGSGTWIARRALQAVAMASDGRGPDTSLVAEACDYFNVNKPDDLSTALYAPNMTHDRIAGFSSRVGACARRRDRVSREILIDAGHELGRAAAAVVRRLRMERSSFQVGYVGGVFKSGDVVLGALREELASAAPKAHLAPPLMPPAVAAARMARKHLALALAG